MPYAMPRVLTGVAAAALTTLAGLGVGIGLARATESPLVSIPSAAADPASAATSSRPRLWGEAAPAPVVGQQQAEAAAIAAVGGGTAVGSHLDRSDGTVVWHVHVDAPDDRYDVKVDATSGRVVEFDRRDGDGPPFTGVPAVDQEAAEDAAVAAAGGGTAVASHLDRDTHTPEWEVIVAGRDGTYYEVAVDAIDGRVGELDRED